MDGRRTIRAELRFRPAAGQVPFESELGTAGSEHSWILAAADCRVDGTVAIDGTPLLEFRGRGYHDHNAGAEELSTSVRRWTWGRAHLADRTCVFYDSITSGGVDSSLWLPRAGTPSPKADGANSISMLETARSGFGVSFPGLIRIESEREVVTIRPRHLVDSGPFYLRWISDWEVSREGQILCGGPGIHELLETRLLNHFLCNWMIPFRLKRPKRNVRPERVG